MRIRTAFLLIAIFVAAMIVQLFMTAGVSLWWKTGIASALAICLLLLYISVVRPMTTLANGFDLLKGQDFGSRLAKVGHKDADRLVEMFNSMMQSLRNERLRKHEQNSFLSLLIEASPMGIITCDFDGNPTGMNPAASRMMKGELAEAVQKIKPGSTDTVRLGDNSIFKVSRLWFMEMGFRRPFILVESLTDEVYRAEKEAYGKVIRLIAHEVNNTMGGVSSMLDTLATVIAPGSELQDIIESCNERCIGLSRFITSYADVVKIPAPVTSPRDLNECLRRQLPFLEGLLPQGITLSFHPADDAATAMVDVVLFEQAMVNIIKNSVESIGHASGKITISTGTNPSSVDIDDDGPGINPEIAGKLFTPFLSTKPHGQGIGLLCVSEVLRRHNCRFSLATIAPGKTRFHIEF